MIIGISSNLKKLLHGEKITMHFKPFQNETDVKTSLSKWMFIYEWYVLLKIVSSYLGIQPLKK